MGFWMYFAGGLDKIYERMDLPFSDISRNNFGGR